MTPRRGIGSFSKNLACRLEGAGPEGAPSPLWDSWKRRMVGRRRAAGLPRGGRPRRKVGARAPGIRCLAREGDVAVV